MHKYNAGIGPATHCDAAHLGWDVLKPPRCNKTACDGLRCIFQHVGNSGPDFVLSQLFIVRFSNGLQHSDGHARGFPVIDDMQLSSKYFS